MLLDIESKLFVEPVVARKHSLLKYRCNISFSNKALDFINLSKLLRSLRSIIAIYSLPSQIDKSDIPMIIYSLNQPIGSKIFNYNTFVKGLIFNNL